MIPYISSATPSIYVNNAPAPFSPTVYNSGVSSPNELMTGVLRYNSGIMEVFNGSNWVSITGGVTSVGLSPEVESILDWARRKKAEEEEIANLAKEYPTVQSLIEKVENAKKQLNVAVALIKDHND